MGYRFLDDYDPRKEQKKKQQQKGTQKAPPSGNPLNPAAQNNKNNKTNTPAATQPRTSKGTALGGSSVTPVQLPQRQLTVPKLTKATVSTRKTTATRVPQQLKIPEIKAFGASMPTARKTAATSRQTVDTATIPEIRAFGAGMPTARKTETTARRAVDTAKMPEIKAFGAGDYSAGAKSLEDFFTRVGKTIAGGSKGALASNMDAMGAAYEAGQGQRTSMYEAELREAQWAVARAKRDYDLDPSQTTKTELDAALTKMKAFATVLGDGAYQQALTAAYDAAVKIGTVETTKELTALYNSLGKVNVDASTGVQQQATEAARDMALDVQVSGGKDIASAKEGLGQFGQMVVDAGASGTQMAIDILLNKVMGTPGSKLPFAFRAFGGATQQARADGADISGQLLYGGAVAAKEVATEMIFNIALPFTKAYGGGALDDVVQNGIQKAVNKLGKTDAGKRALNALLQIGASGMSEGLEEFIGDWMEWQMPRLYGGEVSSAEETLANSLYDYVVGGLSGMGGAVISPGTYRLEMPTLTDAQGRTYEQRQAAEASGQRTATRYTAEEAAAKRKDARTFRNIIAGIDTSISDFFDRWKSGRKSHLGEKLEQLYIAPMPNNMAEDISKIVGYNVNGRDFIVTSDDVKHVMDQHGNSDAEIAKGNIPLETWMLDALPDVVTNPDSIEPGNLGTGNKNAGKRGIVFSKAFPGGKIITIQFDNKGRGTLELNTLYAKESAILEGNGTNAPNTFTPEAAKSALSYAEKTRMSRYTMPNTTESAVPVINVQSGPPQSFSSETSVPQGGTAVNTQGMQNGGEYAAAPAAPLQVPRLTTYEERQAEQRAERVANLVDNIDALHEAVDNGLRSPQLTTYEERARAKAEAEKASVRDRVRQMDAMTDAAAERAVEQRVQQEQQGREMPEALKKLGVAPFGSEADYAGIDNLAQEMQWNGSARKQTQRQMNKIPATEKERSFARKLADGTLDAADIPNTVNRETVETLADFYRTLDSAPETMLLRQRRATIMEREEAKMEPLLGMDVAYDEGGLRTNGKGDRKNSGRIAKTTSTLRRNLQTPARICATEWGTEHGKKVYETLFYPVTENNGRQIDWVNSMLDRVRTFKDSKGEERPLNRKERELVQKIVEYRASEKRVAAFDEQYTGAVENVRNGASAADAAKEFGIDPSYQEYQDLQNYQTYLRTLEELHDSKSADSTAVDSAVEAYSGLYRELYDGINSFLVAHGYQPIGFIEGYAPHMQPEAEKTAFSKALKLLGLDDTAMSLPTSISGKTADLKPYKQYNPFFQERHGVNTEYDIAKGFEEYIYYLSNIFYHTDDIMRIRTAEKYIRKTYSSEEASELINQAEGARDFSNDQIADFLRVSGVVQKGTELTPGDARVFLEDYIGKLYDQIGNVTRYSEMAKYLDNYANRLAGKQNMADRGAEAATGRGSLNWINTLTGKYGGAKLAFNVSSALNQTSQIPMVAAENGERATLHAIGDFFKSKKDRADFVQESNFLKGKKGIDWLLEAETPWEQVKEWSFSPIEAVDSFTSYVAVRSKYLKEIRAGKSHEDAMKLADEFGRHVMGSRARGEKPMLFDTKNPFWQIVTRFQLEALNSWEHISRDLPNEVRQMAREKGKAYAAGTMGVRVAKYMTYAFLLNLGIGALSGGSPVPYDVVGSVMEALGKSMGVSKLAMVEDVIQKLLDGRLFKKDDDDEDDADKDWWAFLGSLWGDIANDVPVVGQVAALLGVGDQTLPTTDLSKVKDFAESVKNNGLLSMDTLDKGLTAAGEFVYAGNQARKTLQGGIAVGQGGVYSKGKLRYQVDQTPWNVAKGLLFGRSALDESQAYYAERTSDFSEKQTEAFRQMQNRGVSAKASYDLLQELRSIEKTEESTKAERQRDTLRQSDVSGAGKWVTYYQTMGSETERKAMDALQYYSEADYGTVTNLLMNLKEQEKDENKMRLIDRSRLSDSQKASLYKSLVAEDEDIEKINALKETGITDYQYLQYKIATSGLTKREAKLNAINTLDLTDNQKDALYYLNSYASSTHGKAPWVQGMTAGQSNAQLAALLAAEEDDGDDTPKWRQSLNSYLGKSENSSGGSRFLSYFAKKNGYTLQEAAPSAPRYSGYLQYLAARDGISLDTEDTGSGLQSKYLREFASRWGG